MSANMQTSDETRPTMSAEDRARQVGGQVDDKPARQSARPINYTERAEKARLDIGEVEDYVVGSSGPTDYVQYVDRQSGRRLVAQIYLNVMTYEMRTDYLHQIRDAKEDTRRLENKKEVRSDLEDKLSSDDLEEINTRDVETLQPDDNDSDELERYKRLSREILELQGKPDEADISIERLLIPNLVWWNAKRPDPESIERGDDPPILIPVRFEAAEIKASLSMSELNGLNDVIYARIRGDMTGKFRPAGKAGNKANRNRSKSARR